MNARTRTRLLDEAERLFAAKGMEACSIRDIVSAARANLGAITYHFGSKRGLIHAVIDRRLRPLNEERLRRLEAAQAAAGRAGPRLEEILTAAIEPTIRLLRRKPNFMRIVGRLLTSPHVSIKRPGEARDLIRRFTRAIALAIPAVPLEEIAWRMQFLRGAMIYTWTGASHWARMMGLRSPLADEGAIVDRLVRFGAAGLRAAVAGMGRKSRPGGTKRRES